MARDAAARTPPVVEVATHRVGSFASESGPLSGRSCPATMLSKQVNVPHDHPGDEVSDELRDTRDDASRAADHAEDEVAEGADRVKDGVADAADKVLDAIEDMIPGDSDRDGH